MRLDGHILDVFPDERNDLMVLYLRTPHGVERVVDTYWPSFSVVAPLEDLRGLGRRMEALRAHDGSESSAYRNVEQERAGGPSLAVVVERWLHRTPIDGLWICGSGAHPGGGIMGAPGELAAKTFLGNLR